MTCACDKQTRQASPRMPGGERFRLARRGVASQAGSSESRLSE